MEGGCGYCNDHRYRPLPTIYRYAFKHGLEKAYNWGAQRGFVNAQVRTR